VVLVLLIVCANLASLLLARAGRRTREVATRMALGSGRAGVIRQLLVESVVLAILGGGLGLAFGYVGLRGLRVLATDAFGIWQPIAFDARVLAVAAGVSLVTSLFFGLAPALHATRLDVSAALAESSARGATVRSTHWARVLLVVGEVAVGVLLVVSAALLVRTFVNLRRLDPGIDPRGVVTATLSLQDARYATSEGMNRLFDDSLARIRRLPGVTAAAVSLGLPYQRLLNLGFRPVGGPGDAEAKPGITNLAYVTPGFFEALRLPLRAGRVVDDSDRRGSRPVAVVNDAFAATYLRDREPIGSRIGIAGDAREIVGIVGGTLQLPSWGEGNDPLRRQPTVYVPAAQTNDQSLALWHTWFQPSWIVRSSLPAGVTMAAVRRAIEAADAQLPLAALRTLERVEGTALASQQFLMTLITALGAIAALLAVVGIHGLVANAVVERTRELGVRLALGATVGQAMRAVAVPGVCLALIGIVIGSGLGLAGARVLRAFLWGVSATDPRTFVGVAASLLLVAVVASVVPALRVLRLDPASTLRHE
jgi:predicted permease